MPVPPERRRVRRLAGGILAIATSVSLVGLAAPSYADDDYPYRGLGQCPLVPLPPQATHPQPGKPGNPHTGPQATPHKPGASATPGGPATPAPNPPRTCAKHIWFYNGTYGDPWGFALRNCTSFVAWRLRATNGFADFSNHLDGGSFGNADQWDDNARALGYLVDDVPAVGAVAQTDDGRVGHVAWVSAVGDGTVTVEEYNYYVAGGYDVRTVPTSDFRYLHLADVSPDPSLGSTRAAATTAAAGGGTWTARTSAGDLTVRPASGPAVRLGPPGVWSTHAAPSVAPDTLGRTWVAAVTTSGRVLVAHTHGDDQHWTHPRPVAGGPWATTSTPTLSLDGQGRVRLLTVSASGDLVERHTSADRAERWSRGDRMGMPGSWSTHAAPAAATDARGRLWIAAVTRGGTLEALHSQPSGRGWSRFRAVDGLTWSTTSSPALTLANDGRLWLTSVTARGGLFSRHTEAGGSRWQRAREQSGVWSPYSSPATTVDGAGRLWLAAVRTDGSVPLLAADPGSVRWRDAGAGPASSTMTSPSFVPSASGGVRVGTVRAGGEPVWARSGTATVVLPLGTGPRAGGFSATLALLLRV